MYISIDLGGTKTRVASSVDLTTLNKCEKFFSCKNLEEEIQNILQAITHVADKSQIEGICLGIPGVIDYDAQIYKTVPNYKILEKQPLNVLLPEGYINIPFKVENDAALAGLAEAVSGAGKEYRDIAYITLSTGVGGVKIVKRHNITSIVEGSYEPGHQIINMDATCVDNAGVKGSMESYLSGTAFKKLYGCSAEDCDDKKVWSDYGTTLAVGLLNIKVMWDPEAIVLGGSLSNRFNDFYPSLVTGIEKYSSFNLPPIIKAVHGDNAGLLGGFEYLKQFR
jgi:glucokinase